MSTSRSFQPSALLTGLPVAAPGEPMVTRVGFEVDLRAAAAVAKSPVAIREDAGWRAPTVADLAAEVRDAAHAQGYASGWAEGRRAAAAEATVRAAAVAAEVSHAEQVRAEQQQVALTAVAAAATGLERRVLPVVEELSESVLTAALVLAQAVLGRELVLATDGGADALRRALDLAPRQRPVTVLLHPEDLATLAVTDATLEIDGRTVTLLPDATLGRGDALAHSDATEIDARLGAALDRAAKALEL